MYACIHTHLHIYIYIYTCYLLSCVQTLCVTSKERVRDQVGSLRELLVAFKKTDQNKLFLIEEIGIPIGPAGAG